MVSVYDLKPRFQALLRPFCSRMASAGITANQVTVAAVILSAVPGGILLFFGGLWPLLLLAPVLLIRMALNAIDGMLAREFGQQSQLGAVFNELGDVVSDMLLYLPLALIPGVNAMLIACLVCVAIIVEMTGVIAVQIEASRRYDGPFGKSDRAVFFGILGVQCRLSNCYRLP